jgi:hypothetical protein
MEKFGILSPPHPLELIRPPHLFLSPLALSSPSLLSSLLSLSPLPLSSPSLLSLSPLSSPSLLSLSPLPLSSPSLLSLSPLPLSSPSLLPLSTPSSCFLYIYCKIFYKVWQRSIFGSSETD